MMNNADLLCPLLFLETDIKLALAKKDFARAVKAGGPILSGEGCRCATRQPQRIRGMLLVPLYLVEGPNPADDLFQTLRKDLSETTDPAPLLDYPGVRILTTTHEDEKVDHLKMGLSVLQAWFPKLGNREVYSHEATFHFLRAAVLLLQLGSELPGQARRTIRLQFPHPYFGQNELDYRNITSISLESLLREFLLPTYREVRRNSSFSLPSWTDPVTIWTNKGENPYRANNQTA